MTFMMNGEHHRILVVEGCGNVTQNRAKELQARFTTNEAKLL